MNVCLWLTIFFTQSCENIFPLYLIINWGCSFIYTLHTWANFFQPFWEVLYIIYVNRWKMTMSDSQDNRQWLNQMMSNLFHLSNYEFHCFSNYSTKPNYNPVNVRLPCHTYTIRYVGYVHVEQQTVSKWYHRLVTIV